MISYALIGLIQALFVPGFLILLVVAEKLKLSIVDKFIISTPLSIVANYLMVATLVYFDIYSRGVMLCIFTLEFLIITFYLYKNYYREHRLVNLYWTHKEKEKSYSIVNVTLYIFSLSILISIYKDNYSGAFQWWDAVASWNRWAIDWFNQSPKGTWGYPVGMPILYSLVYKIGDSSNLQTIARQAACYFPFWGLLCFWRVGDLLGNNKFIGSVAALLYVYLITVGNLNINFIFSGYVDPVMASLGAFILYAILFLEKNEEVEINENRWKYSLVVIFFSVCSVALIKQTGVLVYILFSIYMLYSLRGKIYKNKKFFFILFIISFLLVTSYYIYFMVITNSIFQSFVRADELIPESIFNRIISASKLLRNITGEWFLLIVLVTIYFDSFSRKLFIFFIFPTFIFWSTLVSYDLRTAFIFFSWLAFIVGVGFSRLATGGSFKAKLLLFSSIILMSYQLIMLKEIFQRINIIYIFLIIFISYLLLVNIFNYKKLKLGSNNIIFSIFSVFIAGIHMLPIFYSKEKLLLDNTNQRMVTGNQGFNVHLSNLFEREPTAKMISCFAYPYNIVAAEGRFFPVGSCGKELNTMWLNRSNINYLLHLPPDVNNNPDDLRALLKINGIDYSEEVLARGYILFKRNN
jgi:hypothetical protein